MLSQPPGTSCWENEAAPDGNAAVLLWFGCGRVSGVVLCSGIAAGVRMMWEYIDE